MLDIRFISNHEQAARSEIRSTVDHSLSQIPADPLIPIFKTTIKCRDLVIDIALLENINDEKPSSRGARVHTSSNWLTEHSLLSIHL